jgi:hypothetical protein
MPEPNEIREGLRVARAALDATRRRAQAARIAHTSLLRKKERIARAGDRAALREIENALRRSGEAVAGLGAEQDRARGVVEGLVAGLHTAITPDSLMRFWPAETPILLLPLRVETRFKDAELLVRVFPDEIAIDTHEEIPTTAEAAAGRAYWRAIAVAGTETARKEAWRKLADAFRAPRAGYVVARTKPTNWSDLATVGVGGLVFPAEPVLKEDSWTQPPLVKVLPDRLVLTLSRGGNVIHEQVGELIPDIVQVGRRRS